MSAIASFIKLPKSALAGLRSAAVPQKRFFRGTTDGYHDYLGKYGHEAARYGWSGYVLVTLLPYLQEKRKIDLMHSEYDDLATFLTQSRNASYFILTQAQSAAFSERPDAGLFFGS